MLERVTLTGADNTVEPSELRKLSEDFPFVEWGILIGTRLKAHRMPDVDWIHQLVEERFQTNNTMNLSLHICGQRLRSIANGRPDLNVTVGHQFMAFSRVQLNWHAERYAADVTESMAENILTSFCQMGVSGWEPELIFQLDGVNEDLCKAVMRRFRCSGLFDRSHGAGILPGEWPRSRTDMACGWAGGLGPDNVVEEFQKIRKQAFGPFWIDMETKLYNEDRTFSLEKCRSVLTQMKPFVGSDAD